MVLDAPYIYLNAKFAYLFTEVAINYKQKIKNTVVVALSQTKIMRIYDKDMRSDRKN